MDVALETDYKERVKKIMNSMDSIVLLSQCASGMIFPGPYPTFLIFRFQPLCIDHEKRCVLKVASFDRSRFN